MKNLTYDEIQKLDENIMRKLLTYIGNNADLERILEDIDFVYPYFQDDSNRVAINLWLSTDYTLNDGMTYIDHFLKDESSSLTELEINLLLNKKESYLSLFEIIDYEDDYIIVKDVLQNQINRIWEPNLPQVITEGELILVRIGKFVDEYCFIGNMNYLPHTVSSMFMEHILIDFNLIRKEFTSLTIKDYIKRHSLNLYSIYGECIINAIENNEDITSYLYDQLDEFESYLQSKANSITIGRHISNLIDFFEYYLVDEDMTLYDLDQLDFEVFFQHSIEDGFINSQDSLNSYISSLKMYSLFLSNIDPEYRNVYQELLVISKNRFSYMNQLKATSSSFKIDKGLSSTLSLSLNERAQNLLMDYDRFLLYTVENPLELTVVSRHIKRKQLIELDNILNTHLPTDKGNPNQVDFPLINLFYYISIDLGLLVLNGSYMTLTKKGTNYLRLKEEEKYSLFFQYIWGKDFIKSLLKEDNIQTLEILKRDFVQLLASFKENKYYGMSSIAPVYSGNPSFFFLYYKHLDYLGLISCKLYPNYELMVTPLGRIVFNFLITKENRVIDSTVIDLENYKQSK